MTHVPGRRSRFVLAALAMMCAGVVGCNENAVAPKTVDTPQGPMQNLGTVIIDVDLKHHTWSARPVGGAMNLPPGVDARYFGRTTQIEYALTEGPFNDLGNGDIQYSIHANISNLLTFAIGTNSPHTYPAEPQDTMGIYVYYAFLPYNIQRLGSPCPAGQCTVTIDSADGRYPFTGATPQPYVFWKTILEGGGLGAPGPGPFETNTTGTPGGGYFRRMSFRTHGNVTDFSFGLSVAAAWVEPNESRWKVFYVGDSLPNRVSLDALRSDPDWRRLGSTGTASIAPAACAPNTGACALSLVSGVSDSIVYFRSDSLRASQSGYIAATVTTSALPASAGVFLGLKDPAKLVQLGISSTLTGFTDSTGAFILPTTATVPSRTSYRVVKVGTDSAAIYSPSSSNVPILQVTYASLPPAPVRGSGPPNYDRFFFFGNIGSATTLWSNVNYEIGAASP